ELQCVGRGHPGNGVMGFVVESLQGGQTRRSCPPISERDHRRVAGDRGRNQRRSRPTRGDAGMRWPTVELQEVCKTGSGTTPPRNQPALYEGRIAWVKSGELRENEIFETEEHVSDVALRTTSLKLVPAGALLVA